MSLFDLFDWVKNLIEQLGYVGVFIGVYLEAIFPPIPSEVIMGFSGFLISEGKFTWPLVIITAGLANFLSATTIWFVGHKFGKNFILRWGKYVGVGASDINKAESLFAKHGYKIVFACQMVPLARSWVGLPAGTLKTQYWKFIIANSSGAIIWLTVLAYFGFIAGENWDKIEEVFKPFERIILFLFVAIIGYLIVKFILNKRKMVETK